MKNALMLWVCVAFGLTGCENIREGIALTGDGSWTSSVNVEPFKNDLQNFLADFTSTLECQGPDLSLGALTIAGRKPGLAIDDAGDAALELTFRPADDITGLNCLVKVRGTPREVELQEAGGTFRSVDDDLLFISERQRVDDSTRELNLIFLKTYEIAMNPSTKDLSVEFGIAPVVFGQDSQVVLVSPANLDCGGEPFLMTIADSGTGLVSMGREDALRITKQQIELENLQSMQCELSTRTDDGRALTAAVTLVATATGYAGQQVALLTGEPPSGNPAPDPGPGPDPAPGPGQSDLIVNGSIDASCPWDRVDPVNGVCLPEIPETKPVEETDDGPKCAYLAEDIKDTDLTGELIGILGQGNTSAMSRTYKGTGPDGDGVDTVRVTLTGDTLTLESASPGVSSWMVNTREFRNYKRPGFPKGNRYIYLLGNVCDDPVAGTDATGAPTLVKQDPWIIVFTQDTQGKWYLNLENPEGPQYKLAILE